MCPSFRHIPCSPDPLPPRAQVLPLPLLTIWRRRPAAAQQQLRGCDAAAALLRNAAHAACHTAPLVACAVPPSPRPWQCRAATMVTVTTTRPQPWRLARHLETRAPAGVCLCARTLGLACATAHSAAVPSVSPSRAPVHARAPPTPMVLPARPFAQAPGHVARARRARSRRVVDILRPATSPAPTPPVPPVYFVPPRKRSYPDLRTSHALALPRQTHPHAQVGVRSLLSRTLSRSLVLSRTFPVARPRLLYPCMVSALAGPCERTVLTQVAFALR